MNRSFGFILLFGFFYLFILVWPKTSLASWVNPYFDNNHTNSSIYNLPESLEVLWNNITVGSALGVPLVNSTGDIYLNIYQQGITVLDSKGQQKKVLNEGPLGNIILDNNDNLYFVGSDCERTIQKLDKNLNKIWVYKLNKGIIKPCSNFWGNTPALSPDQNTLYFIAQSPMRHVIALNILDGSLKWQLQLDSLPDSPLTVAPDGTIYVGSLGNSTLMAISPEGSLKWTHLNGISSNQTGEAPVLDSDGNIYILTTGSEPKSLTSYDKFGTRRWIIQSTWLGHQSNFALKDKVIYITEQTTLKAINTDDGQTLWQWSYPPKREGDYFIYPVLDRTGNIYLKYDNQLFVINPNGSIKKESTLVRSLGRIIIPQDNLLLATQGDATTKGIIALGKKTEPTTKTPLIFIPGIGGSEFKTNNQINWSASDGHGGTYSHVYPKDEKVWVNEIEAIKPGNDDYFDTLRLKSDGNTSEADLGLNGTLYSGAYGGTTNFFTSNGYTLDKDFFIFPYDWRKDLILTTPILDAKINQILSDTGATKVDLVAHSMGGLVARKYISDTIRAAKVRKLVELGVPHLGSVDMIRSLRYGNCITDPRLAGLPVCLGVSTSEIVDVLKNFTGAFELMPSQTYYSFYNGIDDKHPLPFRDDADLDKNNITGPLSYSSLKTLLINLGHNTNLFVPTESFHSIDTNYPNNSVDISLISGSGIPTLGQIIEKKINILGLTIAKKDQLVINGDNTVPLFSASLFDSSTNKSLLGNAKAFYTKQEHGSLPNNGPALDLTKNILDGDTTLPPGVSNQPFPLKGKQVSVHSPINIEVTDSSGNKTGIGSDGTIKEEIPESYFDTLDDAKFVWLPEEGNYQIKLAATANGQFDLKIRDFQDNQNDKTINYENIPIQNTTKVETTLNTINPTPPTLNIDQDGNGTIDKQQNPTSIFDINDQIPPEAQISFNPQKQKLELIGTDNASTPSANLKNNLYTITDGVGNITKILTKPTNKTGSLTLILTNITYNADPLITYPTNSFKVTFKIDSKTQKFTSLIQTITIKNQITLRATYDPKKNTTKIESTEYKKKKITTTKSGIALLQLKTSQGKLLTSF